MINLPRLLNNNFQTRSTLHPSRVSIKRNLYALHTASVTLPPKEPTVNVRDWLMLYDKNGKAGVYRVSRARPSYGEQTELTLKHGFCVLGDDTVKETDGKLTGTADDVIRQLWSKTGVTVAPKYWTLGTFAKTPEITVEYSNPKLLDVMWDVLKKVDGYAFAFDQNRFPWVLNLVRLSDGDACEGRFGRNLTRCTVDVDDSALCTRVYLDDRDGYTDAATLPEWGIASETLTVPDGADENDVQAYVTAYLKERGQPRVSITLGGEDMSRSTGESIDRFALGTVCRACLADYGATVRERIVSINIPDVYGDPDGVEIAMANQTETASDYLEKLRNSSRKLSNQSVITNRRIGGVGASLEQTDIELIRTKEELTDTRYRLSKAGLIIDGDAEFVKAFAYQETTDLLGERIAGAESELLVQAGQISAKASQYDVDALGNRVTTAESELLVQAGQISAKVSKDGIISAINLTPEEALIQSKRINLSGYVTMSEFEAEIANVDKLFAGTAILAGLGISGTLMATNIDVASNMKIFGSYSEWQSRTVQTSLPDFTKTTITLPNGNSYRVVTGWADAPSNYRRTLTYLGQV